MTNSLNELARRANEREQFQLSMMEKHGRAELPSEEILSGEMVRTAGGSYGVVIHSLGRYGIVQLYSVDSNDRWSPTEHVKPLALDSLKVVAEFPSRAEQLSSAIASMLRHGK